MQKITTSLVFCIIIAFGGLAACTSTDSSAPNAPTAPSAEPEASTSGSTTTCYLFALNKDTTTVSLSITGDQVSGKMDWQPYEKDGAHGTLSGKKNANGELELLYSYVIEGSHQTETKVMKIEGKQLLIKKGELIDPKFDGNLQYKDVAAATYSEILPEVACQ